MRFKANSQNRHHQLIRRPRHRHLEALTLAASGALYVSCTPPFTSCYDTRSCPSPPTDGGAGGAEDAMADAGTGAAEDSAGAPAALGDGGSSGGGAKGYSQGGAIANTNGGATSGGTVGAIAGGNSDGPAGQGGESVQEGGEGGTANDARGGNAGAPSTDLCQPNPCETGTCTAGEQDYACTCDRDHAGRNCELPRFELLNDPVTAISQDGSTIFGYSSTGMFRRAGKGAVEQLGFPSGFKNFYTRGVNRDGTVLAGIAYAKGSVIPVAFKWSKAGGFKALASNSDDDYTEAFAITADGGTIVGAAGKTGESARAAVWRSDGTVEDVPGLALFQYCEAVGVDGSGQTVMILCESGSFLWTQALGIRKITIPDGPTPLYPTGLSLNGNAAFFAIDYAIDTGDPCLYRWSRADNSFQAFVVASAPNDRGAGVAMSADGAVVIFASCDERLNCVIDFSDGTGSRDLMSQFTRDGIDTSAIKQLILTDDFYGVYGMSADGKVIVGQATPDGGGYVVRR